MNQDIDRYHRQFLLAGIGRDGQERLADATVMLLGCGALGSFSADLLVRAGVGHLIIIDRDFVELTNLQRQVLFDESDVASGLPKAVAARDKLARINSTVRVTAIVDDVNHTNIARYAEGSDLIVDGLDNLETRYLANDLAVRDGLPYLYGAVVGTTGMAYVVLPHGDGSRPWESNDLATPCFRCLFEEPPPPGSAPTCDTVGVLSTAVAQVALFQVTEAIKILTGNLDRVNRRMLNFDVWTNDFMQLDVSDARQNTECPCCKARRFEFLDGRAGSAAAVLCGRNAVQLRPRAGGAELDLGTLAKRLREHGRVRSNDYMLRADILDGRTSYEVTLFNDGRAIVKGTDSIDTARGVYARFVGN